jgi:hypothetical protein
MKVASDRSRAVTTQAASIPLLPFTAHALCAQRSEVRRDPTGKKDGLLSASTVAEGATSRKQKTELS